jgi:ubiquinone/menaquinone biosynthesis C-methylase UbiE
VADWYDDVLNKEGSYQKEVILPNLIRLLEIKKGESVIDIACGQEENSRSGAAFQQRSGRAVRCRPGCSGVGSKIERCPSRRS